MKKGFLPTVLKNKCPKCRQGDLFKHSWYNLSKFHVMNDMCTRCEEDFKKEPGFYFGAAYVSYGLTVALWVAVFVAMYCFNAWGWIEYEFLKHPKKYFISGVVTLVLLLPLIYRLSRSLWIGIFVKSEV